MDSIPIPAAAGQERLHSVIQYSDRVYKIVQFYRDTPRFGPGPREDQKHYEEKLASSVSRARNLLLQYALCNHWDYFCTFTLDESKVGNRFDLKSWYKRFNQWIRDQRKKGLIFKYVIVPERHLDGAWHAHALVSGNMELVSFRDLAAQGVPLPDHIRGSDYYNWPAYQEEFGFCSFGLIKNPTGCAFYITKYISKDTERMVTEVGGHTYYASRGLLRAEKIGYFVNRDPYIDSLLRNKYDFCATGMTHVNEGWGPAAGDKLIDLMGGWITPDISADLKAWLAPDAAPVVPDDAAAYMDFEQLCFS